MAEAEDHSALVRFRVRAHSRGLPWARWLRDVARRRAAFRVQPGDRDPAEATPAGWMPGQPTLKPGPDLVGNVWKVWKPSMET